MTPERENKIKRVLKHRQEDIILVLENVWDPHNVSAVMRSCDATGVQNIIVLNTEIPAHKYYGHHSSASARKWVDVIDFDSVSDCVGFLRKNNYKILSTHLDAESIDLYELDLTEKVALVFGNERYGISDEMLREADANFIIPQMGMIQSLNISVACAVTLYEAYRQRKQSDVLSNTSLSSESYNKLYSEWTSNFKKSKNNVD